MIYPLICIALSTLRTTGASSLSEERLAGIRATFLFANTEAAFVKRDFYVVFIDQSLHLNDQLPIKIIGITLQLPS